MSSSTCKYNWLPRWYIENYSLPQEYSLILIPPQSCKPRAVQTQVCLPDLHCDGLWLAINQWFCWWSSGPPEWLLLARPTQCHCCRENSAAFYPTSLPSETKRYDIPLTLWKCMTIKKLPLSPIRTGFSNFHGVLRQFHVLQVFLCEFICIGLAMLAYFLRLPLRKLQAYILGHCSLVKLYICPSFSMQVSPHIGKKMFEHCYFP